jgi:hypothetical protein
MHLNSPSLLGTGYNGWCLNNYTDKDVERCHQWTTLRFKTLTADLGRP